MTKIVVVLPSQVKGKVLLDLITEVSQKVFGDINIKLDAHKGYLPGPKREDFLGSDVTITFSLIEVQNVRRWFGQGLKTNEKKRSLNLKLETPVSRDYLYNVVSFSIFTQWTTAQGYTSKDEIDLDHPNNEQVLYKFEEFLAALYSGLGSEKAEQGIESRAGLL